MHVCAFFATVGKTQNGEGDVEKVGTVSAEVVVVVLFSCTTDHHFQVVVVGEGVGVCGIDVGCPQDSAAVALGGQSLA